MQILIVHLSDLHARSDEGPLWSGFAGNMVQAAAQTARDYDRVVLAFSGDIAWAGKTEEYLVADSFFAQLSNLRNKSGGPPIIVTSPGNHDLDFSLEQPGHAQHRQQAQSHGHSTAASYKALSDLLANYHSFSARVTTPATSLTAQGCVTALRYGPDLTILNIDSASHAPLKCSPGHLVLPCDLDATVVALLGDEPTSIRLAITHFPPSYYSEASRRILQESLQGRVDLILTGHEHSQSAFRIVPLSDGNDCCCIHLEGGALRGHASEPKSIQLLTVDTQTRTLSLLPLSPLKTNTVAPPPSQTMTLPSRCGLPWAESRLTQEYRTAISRHSLALRHKTKEDVTLDDLFVYPNLRRSQRVSDRSGEDDMTDVAISVVLGHERLVVQGQEKSGKTSLARRLVIDILGKGMCPLLLDADKLESRSAQGWQSALALAARTAFGPSGEQEFVRTLPKSRVLIVDNWPPPIKPRYQKDLVDYIEREFGHVVLMTSKDVMFECMTSPDAHMRAVADSLARYVTYDIVRFGHAKRSELVSKWYGLDSTATHQSYSDSKRRQGVEKLIGDLMGRFVPSWPLYVLLALQTIESAQPMSTTPASHGSLYEALIKSALYDAFGQAGDVDALFHFLAYVAGRLPGPSAEVSVKDIDNWHRSYTHEQLIERSFAKDLKGLLRGRILVQSGAHLRFAYDYIELFFRSMHIAVRLRDPSDAAARAIVQQLIGRLYHNDTANMVLFLAYLDQSGHVMTLLLEEADSLYRGTPEFDMGLGVPAIESLSRFMPGLAITESKPEDNRRKELQRIDDVEEEEGESADDELEGATSEEDYRQLQQLGSSYRTVQILGQILRVFPGSITGAQKLRLARASVSLGLRTLSFMMGCASESKQFMLDRLRQIVRKSHANLLPADVSAQAEALLYSLCEGLAFSVVKHTGATVSLPFLRPLHDAMTKFDSPRVSLDIVLLSVALDAYDEFPRDVIIEAYTKAERGKLLLTGDVVRHLAWQHMHTICIDYRDRQAVCQSLKIRNDTKLITTDEK